ncbi:hypothetical protein MAMC_00440 [Methylacidimicrobium cyclopophantes]|uniref:Intracellular proteinase inhibitor BsuPI domain-containing protein n=1 Tax=Methylacidimicrobium cyclopophantes TaxID=1041766 RepID=A0A5E6MA34_9BACT|nr:BsuPI-related putative proteinase inhibitor [Methylacidimicrobium cyclopophantes]VVM05168.1 hypothetical protein MAMC_00440 [Methylacidimicrobium cyclopophantes]
MKRTLVLALCLLASAPAWAIDVSPSKNTHPNIIDDTPRRHWSLFSFRFGDPKRIEKANQVNLRNVEARLQVERNPFSLALLHDRLESATLRLTFQVLNKGKRTYAFNFPNAQRYDFVLRDAANQPLYVWSADKEFLAIEGMSMLDPGDCLTFTDVLPIQDLDRPLTPGTYRIEMTLAGYPEVSAATSLTVVP